MINYREEEKRILDEILGKGVYDNRIRPSGTNGTGNGTIHPISKINSIRFTWVFSRNIRAQLHCSTCYKEN